mmetsp:Transcript_46704/g.101775  ORF Transcript_46704/g.101775 Transcript_46704/m.101775 type:complete len:212 (+) Transcript_46704:829-1464(+)
MSTSCACVGATVLSTANVVLRIPPWAFPDVEDVGVNKQPVNVEARIMYGCSPIDGWLQPTTCRLWQAAPAVCNHLVPALVELPASPVVVSKHSKPWFVINTWTLPHFLVDPLPLLGVATLIHIATVAVHSTPIKVVAHVDDVVWIPVLAASVERPRHAPLRIVINCPIVATTLERVVRLGVICRHRTDAPIQTTPVTDEKDWVANFVTVVA